MKKDKKVKQVNKPIQMSTIQISPIFKSFKRNSKKTLKLGVAKPRVWSMFGASQDRIR